MRRVVSAVEAATEEMRELISRGEWMPGQRLDLDRLADKLSISRTPVRGALQVLQTEGLVEVVPRVGVFVRVISPAEARDVYAIKGAIEPLAAAWAAERGSADAKKELSALQEHLTAASRTEDIVKCTECVDRIHSLILEMADSDALRDTYRVIIHRVTMLRHMNMRQPGRAAASVKQHARIVEAISRGDAKTSFEAMAAHMSDASESVQRVLYTDTSPEAP